MKIIFLDRKLGKLSHDYSRCVKKMGNIRARIFMARLDALDGAQTLEDVRHTPGRFHELAGDRKGQFACDLDHPYRLIFRPGTDSMSENQFLHCLWSEITTIEIIEITDYH